MDIPQYDELLKSVIQLAIPASAPASDATQYYGQVGDFFGGVWGTIIGAVTFIVVLATWYSSRKIDERSKRYQIFAEMLRTHEEIVSSIRLGDMVGRDALSEILSEFYELYGEVNSINKHDQLNLSLDNRIDVAFILTYYGALPNTVKLLNFAYPDLNATAICDAIAKRKRSTFIKEVRTKLAEHLDGDPTEKQEWRQSFQKFFNIVAASTIPEIDKNLLRSTLGKAQHLPRRKIKREKIIDIIENYKMRSEFGGHQNRLSHYFRNLYGAFSYLDEENFKRRERQAMAKVLRSKLSNYEQALLALNAISKQGSPWITEGLIQKYMPIKNIPQHFFTFDTSFDLEKLFCNVEFEWKMKQSRWKFWR